MRIAKYVFTGVCAALLGCSAGVPVKESTGATSNSSAASSFAEFMRAADAGAERRALASSLDDGRMRGDGFIVSGARLSDGGLVEYDFGAYPCVSKSELTTQLRSLGYSELTDRLPSSERSFDSYAIYTKNGARINVDFSLDGQKQCLKNLFMKYN